MSFLNPDNVKPHLDEIALFKPRKVRDQRDDDEDEDEHEKEKKTLFEELMELGAGDADEEDAASATPFVPGDYVEIVSGDLRHLKGKVVRVDIMNKTVELQPFNTQLSTPTLIVEAHVLVKYVAPGYHVKVVSGRYTGQTGRVASVTLKDDSNGYIASILTDGVNTEITVNVAALQMTSEVATGYGSLGGYELYDLVSLNVNETAMVINVGSERLRIINHMDLVKDVLPQELQKNRNRQSQRSSGFDAQQSTVTVGDIVEVRSGPHVKKKGTVKVRE